MSLVLRYKFNEPTASLTTDSSGDAYDMTNLGSVVSVNDPTYGDVAYFDAGSTSGMNLYHPPDAMTFRKARTFSYWVKRSDDGRSWDATHGGSSHEYLGLFLGTSSFRVSSEGDWIKASQDFPTGVWFHVAYTFGRNIYSNLYIDGSLVTETYNIRPDTGHLLFTIGYSPTSIHYRLKGYLSDFRVYDREVSANDIHTLYTDGPNPDAVLPLTITPRALSVSVVVGSVNGATAYRLTYQKTGSEKVIIAKSDFTDLEQQIRIQNLTPETEYTLRLYSTTGNGYTLVNESMVSTLENSAGNYNANDFVGTSGRFDLSNLDTASVEFISGVMNEIFTTGDSIDISVRGRRGTRKSKFVIKKSKFVNMGANVSISDSEAIVTPFSKDAGSGQSVSLTLSDSSVVAVSYDETAEEITLGGTSYATGDSFVLDGKRATIVDI